jgi:hypothetical protein
MGALVSPTLATNARPRPRRWALAVALATGCAAPARPATVSPTAVVDARPAAADAGRDDRALQRERDLEDADHAAGMRGHFAEVRHMERALLFGRLGGAKIFARSLARTDPRRDLDDRVRGIAVRIIDAPTADVALPLVAQLAAECAGCHVVSNATIEVASTAEPTDDGSVFARMERHQWAADRLWEGLVAPSEVRWREGLTILAQPPLPAEAMTDDRSRYALVERLGGELTRRATAAASAVGTTRGPAFAALLEVCAACHAVAAR